MAWSPYCAGLLAFSAMLIVGKVAMPVSCFRSPEAHLAAPAGIAFNRTRRVVDHWTRERRAGAIARDLYIDGGGLGYTSNGVTLAPYGHTAAFVKNVENNGAVNIPVNPVTAPPIFAVKNSQWVGGGRVQAAVGRVYYEMPTSANFANSRWQSYACSGSVVKDTEFDRSIILTAAHCVYNDLYKGFARNVLFIPDQAAGGSPTDTDCSNDVIGCWVPSFGVVELNWATGLFPANKRWDYAFYVVPSSGAHIAGQQGALDSLEKAAGALPISFAKPRVRDYTYAFGYSYSEDPNFMYCAEGLMQVELDGWWLGSCGLSGGASGGPWIQPLSTQSGSGPIVSVNSWKYHNQPYGIAGPQLAARFNTAKKLFNGALTTPFASIMSRDGQEGLVMP